MWGIDSDEAAAWVGVEEAPAEFAVWPENWLILEVFLAMSTQWIWSGGMEPCRAGLNLAALPVVYEGLGVPRKKRQEVFQGLKCMEAAALAAMNKRE